MENNFDEDLNSKIKETTDDVISQLERELSNKKENKILSNYSPEDKGQKRKMSYIGFANMVYFIMMVLLCLARLVINFGWLNLDELALEVAFSLFVQVGVFGLVPITLVTKFKNRGLKNTFKNFKFNKISLKHVLLSFALGILVTIFNICVANLFSVLLTLIGYETTSSGLSIDPTFTNFLIVVLYSAVLPAIFEEIAHRGLLLNAYKKYGIGKAMILSGIMFGLMHLNIGQFFYASIVGVLLAVLVVVSESIVPAIIVHFTNNFLNTYFDFAAFNNWPGAGLFDTINAFRQSNSPIFVFLISLIVVMAVVVGIAYILKKFFNERKIYAIRGRIRYKVLEEYYLSNWAKGNETPLLNNDQVDAMIVDMQEDWLQLMKEYSSEHKVEYNIEFLNDTDVESKRATLKQNIFFYGALVLSVLVTIFTLIWGLL